MITADRLALLINMPASMLEQTLPPKHRPRLLQARFLGLTNSYEFCYSVTAHDHAVSKLFLRYDPTVDKVFGTIG